MNDILSSINFRKCVPIQNSSSHLGINFEDSTIDLDGLIFKIIAVSPEGEFICKELNPPRYREAKEANIHLGYIAEEIKRNLKILQKDSNQSIYETAELMAKDAIKCRKTLQELQAKAMDDLLIELSEEK